MPMYLITFNKATKCLFFKDGGNETFHVPDDVSILLLSLSIIYTNASYIPPTSTFWQQLIPSKIG